MSRRPFDQILSMDDLKITADRLGNYTFTQDTLSFFDSRILENIFPIDDSRGYFVTSEKFADQRRKFTVRSYEVWTHKKTGKDHLNVETVGGFQSFLCANGAKEYAEKRQGFGMLDKRDFETRN